MLEDVERVEDNKMKRSRGTVDVRGASRRRDTTVPDPIESRWFDGNPDERGDIKQCAQDDALFTL